MRPDAQLFTTSGINEGASAAGKDRAAYRSACRTANRLINESRSDYFASRMDKLVSDAKRRWAAVK